MVSSLYRDILSGYTAWEDSPLGSIAVVVGLLIKGLTTWLTPVAFVWLIFRLPLLNGDPTSSCINTWIVLLGVPGLILGLPILKALRYGV